jgi:DNA polymerase-4
LRRTSSWQKLASDWKKPDGLFAIQPEEVDASLLPLPVGRLPGVGKVNEEQLAKLGVKTAGELRSVERSKLEQEFGRYSVRLYELARGIDENPSYQAHAVHIGRRHVSGRCFVSRN